MNVFFLDWMDDRCFDAKPPYRCLGRLTSSVGSAGESTGVFTACRSTSPLAELGYTVIDPPAGAREAITERIRTAHVSRR